MAEKPVDETKKQELVEKVTELTGQDEGALKNYSIEQLTTYMDSLIVYRSKTEGMTPEQKSTYDEVLKGLNTEVGIEKYFADADVLYKAKIAEVETKEETDPAEPEQEQRLKDSPKGTVEKVSTGDVINANNLIEDVGEAPLGDNEAYFKALEKMSRSQRRLKSRISA